MHTLVYIVIVAHSHIHCASTVIDATQLPAAFKVGARIFVKNLYGVVFTRKT